MPIIILDMRRVRTVDFTAAHMLELIEALLQERGAFLLFSHMPATLPAGQDLQAYFHKVGVTDRQDNVKLFAELDEAMAWAEDRLLEQHHLCRMKPRRRRWGWRKSNHSAAIEPPQCIAAIQACAAERSVAAGQTIFQCGDSGGRVVPDPSRRGAH